MTLIATKSAVREGGTQPVPDGATRDVRDGSMRGRVIAAAALPPIGATLILLSYHHAALLESPDQWQFALFWVGFLSGMLPLVVLACSTRSELTRTCALVGIGLFGMVPKLLRTASRPMGMDEFAHLRQSMEAFLGGEVGHVSELQPITQVFPGMHQAISAFARLTGLPLWQAGLTVVVLAHVLSVLAVFQLVRAAGGSGRGAAVGAVIYTLNPSWLYFDTAVAYESLALPLLLWCLAATVALSRSRENFPWRYLATVAVCAAVLPVVHHLTTIFLCAILSMLIVFAVARRVRTRRAKEPNLDAPPERVWAPLFAAGCLLGSIACSWSGNYDWLVAYLSPAVSRGWRQLSGLVERSPAAEASGGRSPFGGAQNPVYEILSGYLFPMLVLALFAAAIAVLWQNRRTVASVVWACAAIGAMYFVSLPMVLTRGGAEGAHRSWGFSFIGIAVVCGLAWSFGWPTIARRRRWFLPPGLVDRSAVLFGTSAARIGVACMVYTVLAFGSLATAGENISSRFPGSANVGDDARSLSREGEAVTAWVAAHAAVDTPVLADRYVSQQLGSRGRMTTLQPSAPLPLWNLYMSADAVSPEVLQQVLDAEIRYFIVDARMAKQRPRLGFWFTVDEPGVGGADLFPQSALDRFNCLPWLRGVYAAGHLTVYEVDADNLRRTMAGSCEEAAA